MGWTFYWLLSLVAASLLALGSTTDTKCTLGSGLIHDPNMIWNEARTEDDGSADDDATVSVKVSCKPRYLLDPMDRTIVPCDDSTGELINPPTCKAMPRIGFTHTTHSHNMEDEKLNLRVVLTGEIVRGFSFNVAITDRSDSEDEKDNFELKTPTISFSLNQESRMVSVDVKDTKTSGINKNYTLCLSDGTGGGETRAIAMEDKDCITVTVLNNNAAALSLAQRLYTFTSESQTLSVRVGYRADNISVDITLTNKQSDQVKQKKGIVIDKDCGALCLLDLVSLKKTFQFGTSDIGSYSLTLERSSSSDGGQVNIEEEDVTVELTMTPLEISKESTEVRLGSGTGIFTLLRNGSWKEEPKMSVEFIPPTSYSMILKFTAANDEQFFNEATDDSVSKSQEVVYDPRTSDQGIQSVNLKQLFNDVAEIKLCRAERLTLTLDVVTSRFVGDVYPSQKTATVALNYEIKMFFGQESYIPTYNQWDDTPVPLTLNASRPFDLYQYPFKVISKSGDVFKLFNSSENCEDGWEFFLDGIKPLEKYELRVEPEVKSDEFIIIKTSGVSAEYVSGAELNFEEVDSHTFTEDLTVTIVSSRVLTDQKLDDLVKLELHPKYVLKLDSNVKPSEGGKEWNVPVTMNSTASGNATIYIVMTPKEEYIYVTNNITIVKVTEATTSPTQPLETDPPPSQRSSWFGSVMLVLIGLVVITVAIYIAYSNREQLMNCLRDGGEGGGGGGRGGARDIITRARTRLRSRGAYKKLPSSVQEAMTVHND